MKKSLAMLASGALATGAVPAQASTADPGFLSVFHGMAGGQVIFFSTGTRSAMPACATTGANRWAIDGSTAAGQVRMSILLTAWAQRKRVIIVGTGNCSVWGDTETVDFFYTESE
ncbi:hypothetical protein [Sphingobium lignivorans]|uniref:Uncharacterized protein n=1 Tax=Sphingobium lignivorans TaxID=2735886 RepID=A0ABR6NHA2_9SPHN|nr:hypothetical protein [Sphingobium lignivorans]MBB5986667.1 hypothetical protein [Sphingobium lignivorans]